MVATLFAGGITWMSSDRYVVDGAFSARSGTTYTGAYTPYSDDDVFSDFYAFGSSSSDTWTELELLSVVAFVLVLIAAAIEAISVRQVPPGIVTVAAPCAAFGLLLLATPGVLDSVQLGTMTTIGVVLVAVAVREVWARRFAPQPS